MTEFKAEVHVDVREPTRSHCTLIDQCSIEPGETADYMRMSHWHYRGTGRPPAMRQVYRARYVPTGDVVGVIVFAAPSLGLAARNRAIPDRYNFGVGTKAVRTMVAGRVNREIDLIIRVVMHPTFRGIGLAVKLVKETICLRPFPFVEASAAMGAVNPFFEKAGMKAYPCAPTDNVAKILGALRSVGLSDQVISNPSALVTAVKGMPVPRREFIEAQLKEFERRWMRCRSGRALSLTLEGAAARVASNALIRPVYYLWINRHLV